MNHKYEDADLLIEHIRNERVSPDAVAELASVLEEQRSHSESGVGTSPTMRVYDLPPGELRAIWHVVVLCVAGYHTLVGVNDDESISLFLTRHVQHEMRISQLIAWMLPRMAVLIAGQILCSTIALTPRFVLHPVALMGIIFCLFVLGMRMQGHEVAERAT
jgi:hypothetical protein